MKISHVSFDLWGTLIESNPAYKPMRNELISRVFDIDIRADEIAARKQLVDYVTMMSSKVLSYEQIMAIILGQDISKFKIGEYRELVLTFDELNDELVRLYPPVLKDGVVEVLNSLSGRVSMSTLSNTSFIGGGSLREALKTHGIDKYLSFQLYSDEINMAKPYPGVYKYVCFKANKRPCEIIHVGDDAKCDNGGGIVESLIIQGNNLNNILKMVNETQIILSA